MLEIYREYRMTRKQYTALVETGYSEVSYIDHYSDGREVKGTEDFTWNRWKDFRTRTHFERTIWVPTGETRRDCKRVWEPFRTICGRSVKEVGKIAKLVMVGREYSLRMH